MNIGNSIRILSPPSGFVRIVRIAWSTAVLLGALSVGLPTGSGVGRGPAPDAGQLSVP